MRARTLDMLDILSILSITIVALVLIVLFKVKAGILGIVLGVIAVATLIYWLKEAKQIFRRAHEAEWFYDLTDDGESLIFTADVPGPPEEVNVRLSESVLEIKGGRNFMRSVSVPKEVQVQEWSYKNGVLHVRLQKLRRQGLKEFVNE